jgi:hypothetical protein
MSEIDFEVILTIPLASTFPPCFFVRYEMIPSSALAVFIGISIVVCGFAKGNRVEVDCDCPKPAVS